MTAFSELRRKFFACSAFIIFAAFGSEGHAPGVFDGPVLFDAYFHLEAKRTRFEHLDNFAKALERRADEMGYIVSYGTVSSLDCESLAELKLIRNYLVKTKNIEPSRIAFFDGGFRTKGMTEFYLGPKGSTFPEPRLNYRLDDLLNPKNKQ